MTAQRDSFPGYYQADGKTHEVVRAALELGGFAFSHVEGFLVLVASSVCFALGFVLWAG